MYDVSRRSTFNALGDWLVEIRTHLPQPSHLDNVVFAVCANKVHMYVACTYRVEPLIEDTLSKRHLCMKDTF